MLSVVNLGFFGEHPLRRRAFPEEGVNLSGTGEGQESGGRSGQHFGATNCDGKSFSSEQSIPKSSGKGRILNSEPTVSLGCSSVIDGSVAFCWRDEGQPTFSPDVSWDS